MVWLHPRTGRYGQSSFATKLGSQTVAGVIAWAAVLQAFSVNLLIWWYLWWLSSNKTMKSDDSWWFMGDRLWAILFPSRNWMAGKVPIAGLDVHPWFCPNTKQYCPSAPYGSVSACFCHLNQPKWWKSIRSVCHSSPPRMLWFQKYGCPSQWERLPNPFHSFSMGAWA